MANLIISTLAEYQTRFWLAVGGELERRGHRPLFLSFDTRSNEMLEQAQLEWLDATSTAQAAALGGQDAAEVCRRVGVAHPERWLTHEKFAFGSRDSDALLRKLAASMLLAERAFDQFPAGEEVLLVQELGGFLSVLGAHFVALARSCESWLIEPSFFRGRLLFIEGSLDAFKLPRDARAAVQGDVARYLDDAVGEGRIVIPEKDRHQYTTAFRKVVNARNLKRLFQKMADKYVLRKEQEFGHIGNHVSAHANMILASRKLRGAYTPLEDAGSFLYYPLHVPGDVVLTLRTPEYLDQIALIDYLCRITPLHLKVAVKEHPAMIGAMGADALLKLKRRYDRFMILPPSTNNYEVLRRCSAVVTVNSKSGAEAGLLGKKVIVLGDAFYSDAPFARLEPKLAGLADAIVHVASGADAPPPTDEVRGYFASLWGKTHPGELYVETPGNVVTFVDSMLAGIGLERGS